MRAPLIGRPYCAQVLLDEGLAVTSMKNNWKRIFAFEP